MSQLVPLAGPLTREHVGAAAAALESALADLSPVVIDLGAVTAVDSAGAALLSSLARVAHGRGQSLTIVHARPEVERALAVFPAPHRAPIEPVHRPGLFERTGERGYAAWDLTVEFLVLAADLFWFTLRDLRYGAVRWAALTAEMAAIGSRAFGVVGLIAFLVGGTMALQSAVQLRQFGANIFVADLVGVSLTRELGPLITAIVVAGRSGSAIAAELGTMVVTEEIDALKTMGIHPTRFLVVPKALAITITQPLLTMYANALAIFGGFLVAITYLDIGPLTFLHRLREALYVKDLLTGLVKSVVFANLIVSIGALCGFRTGGGADAVGRSTTASVVASIFAVIVADAVFSLIFYFGG